jgi:hypothetical protein
MATVNYKITGMSPEDWSGSFTVSNAANPIKTELPSLLSVVTPSFSFVPTQFAYFGDYVTWRSIDISGQPPGPPNFLNIYPRSGYSFDLWCPQFIADVNSNQTWNSLNTKIYNLNENKNTLIYNYDIPCPIKYITFGLIEFTVV